METIASYLYPIIQPDELQEFLDEDWETFRLSGECPDAFKDSTNSPFSVTVEKESLGTVEVILITAAASFAVNIASGVVLELWKVRYEDRIRRRFGANALGRRRPDRIEPTVNNSPDA